MILFDKWKEMHGYAEEKEPDLKELVIEGKSITEHIQEIYDTSSKIEEFLNRSYHFLQYALKERAWLTM